MKGSKRIVFGILLVLVGVAIALTATGVIEFNLPEGISAWRLIVGALLLLATLDRLCALDMTPAMLMLGFEVMIFEEYIGALIGKTEANWINNWLVVLIAVLLGMGLDMLFKGLKGKKHGRKIAASHAVAFGGDNLKYIDCSKFEYEYVSNKFGDTEIRFENSDMYRDGGTLEIDNIFGDMEIYIPSDWEVITKLDNIFGDINISSKLTQSYADGSGRTLTVTGNNKFGDIDIRAI